MTGVLKKDILDYSHNSNAMISNQLTMEAILTRDQRTTSHRVMDPRSDIKTTSTLAAAPEAATSSLGVRIENIVKSDEVSRSLKRETTSCESCSLKMKNSYSRRIRGYSGYRGITFTWLRLGSLLVTLLVASIHAAPTMTSRETRNADQVKWVNTCGHTENAGTDEPRVGDPDDDLYEPIVILTKQALTVAESFREKFTQAAFGLDVKQTHDLWKSQQYDWLPSKTDIPKGFNEQLDDEYLNNLDLDTVLVDCYEYLQKYIVALEQVVWDQEDLNLNFGQDFSQAMHVIRPVLCEIQMALQYRRVKPRPDVTRDIMPKEYRNLPQNSTGERNVRDWLIFRDYMNGLQYVQKVFEHFQNKS